MFDVGGGELILIVLVILLLFGPEKLPEFTKTINKGLRKVKQAQAQFQTQINEIQKDIDTTLDVDDDQSKRSDFKPIPPSENKIGAFDQLDLDKNFIAEFEQDESPDKADSPAESEKSSDTPHVEKESTKKVEND
jgi:sec-independent protein translocase protein TatA